MKSYLVDEKRLIRLIHHSLMLKELNCAGVGDWRVYGEAMSHYEQNVEEETASLLKTYPEFIEKEDYTL